MQVLRVSLLIGLCALISCEDEKRMMGSGLALFLGLCQTVLMVVLFPRNDDIDLRNILLSTYNEYKDKFSLVFFEYFFAIRNCTRSRARESRLDL